MAKKSSKKPASPTATISPKNTKTLESTDEIAAENTKRTAASTVIWRIENVSFWEPNLHGLEIFSSEFVLHFICANTWRLHLTRPLNVEDLSMLNVHLKTSCFVETIGAEWSFVGVDGSILYPSVAMCQPTTADSTCVSTRSVYVNDFNTFIQNDVVTIRLRVWKRGETSSEEEEHVQLVTRCLNETSFQEKFFWRISNFSALPLNSGVTTTMYMRGDVFRLTFFLRGEQLDEAGVGFSISTKSARDQGMQVTINLVSENNETSVKAVETKLRFTRAARNQTWIFPDLMSRQKILEKRTEFLENGVLVFSCGFLFDIGSCLHSYTEECYSGPQRVKTVTNRADGEARQTRFSGTIISLIVDQKTYTMQRPFRRQVVTPPILNLKSSQGILLSDIRNLFTKMTFSDFELRAENHSISVHKNILCARSAVFEEMLCGDMKEASSMDVADIDYDTLWHFVNFLYTGTVKGLQWEGAMKLYDFALQYRVHSLKDECHGILMSGIHLANAADIFEMADRVQDQELRSYAFDFIQYNFETVVLSDQWGKFQERSLLAGKTMKKIFKNRKQMRTV